MKKSKKQIAFGWYGGKFTHLEWLLPLLPKAKTFVDVFGGSGSVIINRLDMCKTPVYNDKFSRLFNFFKQLRENHEELISLLELTPYSREEYNYCHEISSDPLEDARRFFVCVNQSFMGIYCRSWSYCIDSRDVPRKLINKINNLGDIAALLRRLQIDNLDALEVLERYDSEGTLFYLDPPYIMESRTTKNCYALEMTEEDHIKLAEKAKSVKGLVAVSGYHGPLQDELYKDFFCYEDKKKQCHSRKGEQSIRQEVLWTNYDVKKLCGKKEGLQQEMSFA